MTSCFEAIRRSAATGCSIGATETAFGTSWALRAMRLSEVAALDGADLEVEPDGPGRLAIRHSKTDQEGEGAIAFVGAPTVRRVRA